MKAAILHTLGQSPRYEEFPEPTVNEGEVLVHVRAASLKQLDKARANGTHYDSHRELPAVVGVDGVGVLDDGRRVYFGGFSGGRAPYGAMAERTVVPSAMCFPVSDNLDDATAAALPNPAISAWLPLAWRARLVPGETVVIMGATGTAGKLAIQLAKLLGAGRVVAAGRNAQVLETLGELGADATISLDQTDQALTAAFVREASIKRFDIIIDYLWGHPTEVLLGALTGHDLAATASPIRWVEVGSIAGPAISLPAAALRSTPIEIYGSGGGSVPREVMVKGFPEVMALAASGKLRVDTEQVPLAEVEQTWNRKEPNNRRIVFIP